MKQFIELFKSRPFEVKISLLVCLLGVVRLTVAVGQDISRGIVMAELVTDTVLLCIFCALFYLAFTKPSFKGIHPLAGFLLLILICFNFVQFAGVRGNSEFNILVGILALACLFSGRWMYILTFTLLAIAMVLQLLISYNSSVMQSFVLYSSDTYSDFVFGIIAVVIITLFLKQLATRERDELEKKITELNEKVILAKSTSRLMVQKHSELEQVKAALELEVEKRTKHLTHQNKAIEKYIHYNTEELKEPLKNLIEAVDAYRGDSVLYPLLQLSSHELKTIVGTINGALQSDQKLDRSKIR